MKWIAKIWTWAKNRWEGWRYRVAFRKSLPQLYEYTVALLRDEKERADRLAALIEQEDVELNESGLDAAQVERLALMAEQCGAVAQMVSWILRGGYDAMMPYGPRSNRVGLERALGNLRAVINLMHDAGDVRGIELITWQQKYRGILRTTTLYQRERDER